MPDEDYFAALIDGRLYRGDVDTRIARSMDDDAMRRRIVSRE
jgi:hypothetical protein